MDPNHKILFDSVKIRNLELKNRFAMAPMGPAGLGDNEGGYNQRGIDYYTERARGGTGLIITGIAFVENESEPHEYPSCPTPSMIPGYYTRTAREMTERIHAYGSAVFLQLSGGFGRVYSRPDISGPVSASEIPHRWQDMNCHELTVDQIHHIVEGFGKAAAVAKHSGFDGVEIHAVHEGYLMDQFAISFFNHRTDEYGGSLENRLRFAKETVEEIKRVCGEDFPVIMRYSPKSFIKDWREGGLPGEVFEEKGRDMPEGLEAAKLLVSYGYDALDVDVGCYDAWWWNHPPMYQKKGLFIPYARAVKEVVDVPILCAGRMDDPDMAAEAVRSGACDIVSLGRPLLADPDYVRKLQAGKPEDIRPCIGCQEGCMGRLQRYGLINCAVNPTCAREHDFALQPLRQKKKIAIVGGGIAGCEAARVLTMRGHEATLFEASDHLGGAFYEAGEPSFKEDDRALIAWYDHTLKQLGADVRLNTPVDSEKLLAGGYDAIICATGAKAKMFTLPGPKPVLSAREALERKGEGLGSSVAVIGGGMVGCELALWLTKDLGKKVTLVEALDKILAVNAPLCSANKDMLERLVPFWGTDVHCNAQAVRTTEKGIVVRNMATGAEEEYEADSVLLAIGFRSERTLYNELREHPDVYVIGDSRQFRNVHNAVWDAYELANHL